MPLIYTRHDPRFHDRRLHKGGGDGGAADMRRQEEERQAKVQQAVDAINAKFGVAPTSTPTGQPSRNQFTRKVWKTTDEGGMEVLEPDDTAYQQALAAWQAAQPGGGVSQAKTARDSMYADISGAVRDSALRDLDQQYSKASRSNLFGLARAGLLGGSVDAESGGELQRVYGEGRMRAEQQGVQAAADLRGQDEKTRQNLISLAQSGLDTGTAASMAAGQMSAAADLARSQAQGATVGNLFDNLGQAYLTNQVLRARYPNGLPQQSQNTSPYSTNVFAAKPYVGRASN